MIFAFTILFCACERQKTAGYFLTHPEEIAGAYDRCVTLDNKITPTQSRECEAVLEVIPIFRSNLFELMNSPRQFGLNIMRAEIKLVQLQDAYNQAMAESKDAKFIENAKRDMEKQVLEIQGKLALIHLLFKMHEER